MAAKMEIQYEDAMMVEPGWRTPTPQHTVLCIQPRVAVMHKSCLGCSQLLFEVKSNIRCKL
jgi:hypothetical protein